MVRTTRVTKTKQQKALNKWDMVNAECNAQALGSVKEWRHFKPLLKKKKVPGTFLVSNEANNHVALVKGGKLYNPNDYTEITRDQNGNITEEDDSLPKDGFENVLTEHRPLVARTSRLNWGEGGTCRLSCLCMLTALKTDEGRADMINMEVRQFIKKYAKGDIKKYMKRIGIY